MGSYIAKKYDARYWAIIWSQKNHCRRRYVTQFVPFDVHKFFKEHSEKLPNMFVLNNGNGEFLLKIDVCNNFIKILPKSDENSNWESYSLEVITKLCKFGGKRYFIKCLCGRKYKILYITHGFLICRKCLNLQYYSQSVNPTMRYLDMQSKIEKKLKERKGDWGGVSRPRYMHRKTYRRLLNKFYKYEELHINYLVKIFGRKDLF